MSKSMLDFSHSGLGLSQRLLYGSPFMSIYQDYRFEPEFDMTPLREIPAELWNSPHRRNRQSTIVGCWWLH